MNANNLGGFKRGPGGTDNVIQTITAQGTVFAGVGSYPLEGGYIYFTPTGGATVCYKMGLDSNGAPSFTLVGQSNGPAAGRVGVGIPTVCHHPNSPWWNPPPWIQNQESRQTRLLRLFGSDL